MKHLMLRSLFTRAVMVAGVFGLSLAGLVEPASANTVNIIDQNNGNQLQATVECTGAIDPSCAGIVGGSLTLGGSGNNRVVAGTEGSLDLTDPFQAHIYQIGNNNIGNATRALNFLAGTDFLAEDATRLKASELGCVSSDDCSFQTSFAWMIFKIGDKTAFINNLLSDNLINVVFDAVSGTGSGLSSVTFYGFGTVIPIPATLPLFLTGLLGLGFLARRRRQLAEA